MDYRFPKENKQERNTEQFFINLVLMIAPRLLFVQIQDFSRLCLTQACSRERIQF
jgi:hypothetical protein